MEFDKDLRSVQEVRDLLAQAKQAQKALAAMTQEQLDAITAAISRTGAEQAARLAALAVEETGFGRKEDKEIKNRFAAVTLYEAIKDQKTHGILAEDRERRTVDIGVPVGVVAGLVPSTNPTSTVIYKAMICMKAGNPIVFSPTPVRLAASGRRWRCSAGRRRRRELRRGRSPVLPPPPWRLPMH